MIRVKTFMSITPKYIAKPSEIYGIFTALLYMYIHALEKPKWECPTKSNIQPIYIFLILMLFNIGWEVKDRST